MLMLYGHLKCSNQFLVGLWLCASFHVDLFSFLPSNKNFFVHQCIQERTEECKRSLIYQQNSTSSTSNSSCSMDDGNTRHCMSHSHSCCNNNNSSSCNERSYTNSCSCTRNSQQGRSLSHGGVHSSFENLNELSGILKNTQLHSNSNNLRVLQEINSNTAGHSKEIKTSKRHCIGKENNPSSAEGNTPKAKSQNSEHTMQPISTERLRPIRQKTRNAVVSILSDGTVALEFLQSRNGIDYVVEVIRISEDGIKVTQYQPNGKSGIQLLETPPDVCHSAICYAFSGLPSKLWKKYQYAEKFVRLVKMKTPKVLRITQIGTSKLFRLQLLSESAFVACVISIRNKSLNYSVYFNGGNFCEMKNSRNFWNQLSRIEEC